MNTPLSVGPTDAERMKLIEAVTSDAAAFLGVDPMADGPAAIVKKINAVIVDIVFGRPAPIPDTEEKHLVLGCLWGAQMVREFGWSWADIRSDAALDVAVVSPSRDMVIYPLTFAAECIRKLRICTVELSFNMLRERKGDAVFQPGGYEDVMAHIRHIVPPYTLEKSS
jgi:hypothetical protein